MQALFMSTTLAKSAECLLSRSIALEEALAPCDIEPDDTFVRAFNLTSLIAGDLMHELTLACIKVHATGHTEPNRALLRALMLVDQDLTIAIGQAHLHMNYLIAELARSKDLVPLLGIARDLARDLKGCTMVALRLTSAIEALQGVRP
jgi:hypothetical protein